MRIHSDTIILGTQGFSDIHDLTPAIREIIADSGLEEGLVNVFAVGSTASISTIEFEPALVADMQDQLETFASRNMESRHSQTWGDDNGFSHIRATFMGPGTTIPLYAGDMVLGTWQQVVVIDHDNRPRERKIFVQIIGQ